MEQETSDWILFFGRFHPLVLHLPIGFLILAFSLELLSRFDRFSQYKYAVGFVLLAGAVSAVVAAMLGYMLSQEGGYDADLLAAHQWTGIGVAIAALSAYFLRMKSGSTRVFDKTYLTVMSLMMVFLLVAGHYGGSLTHGSDFLVQYMPDGIRSVAGLSEEQEREVNQITNLQEAEVFDNIIYPILDARCTSCHNKEKRKGELMMQTREGLMKGGENGPVLLPGNAEKSSLVQRIHLPEMDDDHMPPKGKRQLTDEQVELLTWWVNEGAPFEKRVMAMNLNEKILSILNTLVDPDANKTEVEILLASPVKPVDEKTLKALKIRGVVARPVSAEVNWLQANANSAHNHPVDSLMAAFADVSEQLTWLNLGETGATDKILSSIAMFKNLTRLSLEKTKVTDEGLKHLEGLSYLEYLNLYGTNISDKGIQQLAGLKNLRKLYVWQTKVTIAGADSLRRALPALEINLGQDNPGI
ncbi:MAG: c-type cytochrome domain-containing protein [Cyclobacteriaceae bacterium]